ncbi:MAG: ABC transporter substrate-binding protein [Tyzzerella sp.]|uniref:ABC transporter substrate-binding protein n=1 Tax=Candidatus Fimicola merdigallinarum TaxID=2840819 RepID=A0A9D9H4Z2_9FIRM|nr:ABC transporter substrate-binding protein [Candidatus Fimicola merdigallinarum]
MKRKVLVLLLSMVVSTGVIVGCQNSDNTENTVVATNSNDEDYGTVVIKNGDREVVFTEMPQKVICCHLYTAENMVMLGLADKIAGKNIPTNDAEKPLLELENEFENIPEIKKSNESVVAAGADLVIGQVSAFKDSAWGSYEKLESQGIKALTITGTMVQDETIEDVYTDIENLGKIFKVEDRAEKLISDIKSKIEETQNAVKDIKEEDKVKVFVMDSFKGNEIYTTSSGLESNLIELAGGINTTKGMADSRWFNTSVETLVSANPDVIIFNDYGSQTIEEKMDFINNNPALSEVTAVKNKSYFTIPLVEVMQDIRSASACEKFAKFFYPQCFEVE